SSAPRIVPCTTARSASGGTGKTTIRGRGTAKYAAVARTNHGSSPASANVTVYAIAAPLVAPGGAPGTARKRGTSAPPASQPRPGGESASTVSPPASAARATRLIRGRG